ncbi:MAG: hypothetical protein Q9187_004875 [Circinaria calcarea]
MGLLFTTVTWAISILLAAYVVQVVRHRSAFTNFKRQKGCMEPRKYPHKEPILGLDLFFAMGKAMKHGQMLDRTRRLFDIYGRTFQINSWGKTVINTCEPRNVQTVLSLAFDSYGVEAVKPAARGGSFMAQGIFTADGAIWARSRALIRPTFARPQISNLASLETHVNQLLNLIPRDGSTIDLQPLIKRLFLDTSTEFLFGESVESLSPNTPFDSTQFLESFNICMRGLAARMRLGKFTFIRGRDREWKEAIRKVHVFIDKHVETVLKGQSSENNEKLQGERYILLNEMAKETDTLFHLVRDPDRWNKLRLEVLTATSSEPLSFELLKSIKYLRYIFNESLRLHPLAGRLRRICHKDTILPLGGGPDGKAPIFIKKGTGVVMNVHAMHRDRGLWGENADDFCPERWETARPTWEYLPFSGGPRICPAQQMVFTEAAYIIVRLIQEFSSIENQDPEPWTELFRMTVESKNGVKVKMIPA